MPRARIVEALQPLASPTPDDIARKLPHQLSGGTQQYVMIVLAGFPSVIVADEATKSLNASTQAQIMPLLLDLPRRSGTVLILISHDLRLTIARTDRVIVMQAGRVIKQASA